MPAGISVVVPAYNAAAFIGETLESVLAQTAPAEEVVVVDDGSTDDLAAALRPYEQHVRLIRQDNAGCGAAFNTAIAAAEQPYVALCPADDLWVPEKLEWQREALREHPEIDVSFGRAENFGVRTHEMLTPSAPGIQPLDRFRREMAVTNRIPDPSVVLRRALHQRLGGFVADVGEDYEFWFRAMDAGAVFHADDRLLVRLRQHESNLSANAVAIWSMMTAVHERWADDFGDAAFSRRLLARDHRVLARCRLGLGDAQGAAQDYQAAWRSARRPADALRAAGAATAARLGAGAVVRRLRGISAPAS